MLQEDPAEYRYVRWSPVSVWRKVFFFISNWKRHPQTCMYMKRTRIIFTTGKRNREKWCLVAKPTNLRQVHLDEHEHFIKTWRSFCDIVQVAVPFSAEIPCRLEKIQAVSNFLKFIGEKRPIRRFSDSPERTKCAPRVACCNCHVLYSKKEPADSQTIYLKIRESRK
jgi:hypothetical protein